MKIPTDVQLVEQIYVSLDIRACSLISENGYCEIAIPEPFIQSRASGLRNF